MSTPGQLLRARQVSPSHLHRLVEVIYADGIGDDVKGVVREGDRGLQVEVVVRSYSVTSLLAASSCSAHPLRLSQSAGTRAPRRSHALSALSLSTA